MEHDELEHELERLHAASWGWALACCARDHDRAGDVLQTTYLKILDGRARFDGRSTLKTWLFGVIRRTAREDERRRRVRALRFFHESAAAAVPASEPAPDAAANGAQRRERVRAALQRLSGRQREVLELVFYHDMTIEEAAAVMRVSVGSARTHYARGKERLADLLALEERP